MKPTIEQLESKYRAIEKHRADVAKEIEDLREKLEQLESREAAAAETGDIERYKKIKSERTDTEDAIFVKGKTAERYNGTFLDADEIISTWSNYAKGYNKELANRVAELARIRKALRKEYEGIINLQNNALETRARCVQYLGGNRSAESFLMDYAPFNGGGNGNFNADVKVKVVIAGMEKWVSLRTYTPEIIYMMASEEWTSDDLDRAIAILANHNSKANS